MKSQLIIFLSILSMVTITRAQQSRIVSVFSTEMAALNSYTTDIRCLGVTSVNDPYINDATFRTNWYNPGYDDSWWSSPVMLPSGWCPTCGYWPPVWGIGSEAIPIWAPLHPDSLPESGMYLRHKSYLPGCSIDSARLYLSIDDDIFKPDNSYPASYHGLSLAGQYIDLSNYDFPDQHEDRIEVLLSAAQMQGLQIGAENLICFFARDGWRILHRRNASCMPRYTGYHSLLGSEYR